jgi:hypothetical protein
MAWQVAGVITIIKACILIWQLKLGRPRGKWRYRLKEVVLKGICLSGRSGCNLPRIRYTDMLIVVILSDTAPRSPYVNWCFGVRYNLHLQGKNQPSKKPECIRWLGSAHWFLAQLIFDPEDDVISSSETSVTYALLGAISCNIAAFITAAVRTSNPTIICSFEHGNDPIVSAKLTTYWIVGHTSEKAAFSVLLNALSPISLQCAEWNFLAQSFSSLLFSNTWSSCITTKLRYVYRLGHTSGTKQR